MTGYQKWQLWKYWFTHHEVRSKMTFDEFVIYVKKNKNPVANA